MLDEMRLSTTACFASGCGLALVLLTGAVGGHAVLDGLRAQMLDQAADQRADQRAALQSMTPAANPASEHTVVPPVPGPSWMDPPAAPPPPLPFQDAHRSEDVEWQPGEARLPPFEAIEDWNPDDARIPSGAAVVATRAYWNPNSAILPRPSRFAPPTWNPDDARLPSS